MPSGRRHYRLTLADALSAHERALSKGGGLPGIPNIGMVESAISRPYDGHYPRIARKTAALIQSMAGNHGFADGNKRTTIILMHLLLAKSGYRLISVPPEQDLAKAVEDQVIAIVRHDISFDELATWLKQRISKL